MVTTEALKLLYRKLGGTADVEDITAISEMVDLIEDVAGSGGGGGGDGAMYVEINPTSMTEGTCEYTANELAELLEQGKTIFYTMLGWRFTNPCVDASQSNKIMIQGITLMTHPFTQALIQAEVNVCYDRELHADYVSIDIISYATPQ